MTRYYFNLHECGIVTRDDEGFEMTDLEGVRRRALYQARSIMAAEVTEGRLCLDCHIEVLDARGDFAARVPFREALALSGA